MKKLIGTILLLFALSGCTTETKYGPCVGVTGPKDPSLVYEVNIQNVAIGVIFAQTVVVPIYIVLKAWECPEGKRGAP